ncbi:hypothetical protein TNCV_681271 [Trichonephila clavipes]|nr:hypothetical protein TNCV_681271 [Trichonephila clavipes]
MRWTPDRKAWVRCSMPPNTIREHTDNMRDTYVQLCNSEPQSSDGVDTSADNPSPSSHLARLRISILLHSGSLAAVSFQSDPQGRQP